MIWRNDRSDFAGIYGMDPSADWLLRHGWDEYARKDDPHQDGPRIPFVVELLSEDAATIMKDSQERKKPEAELLPIYVPPLNPEIAKYNQVYATANRQFFLDLANLSSKPYDDFRKAIKRIKLGLPLKAQCEQDPKKAVGEGVPLAHPAHVELGGHSFLGSRVFIGVIDDGIAFANDRFLSGDCNTRIAYFWRQDGWFNEKTVHGGGSVKSTVPYGREIAADRGRGGPGINDLLRRNGQGGVVDEDQVYAHFGSMNFLDARDHKPVAQRRAHGTHVLDLMAGYSMEEKRTDRQIVAVQLPIATTADTSGSTLEVYVKHAIDYILQRCRELDHKEEVPLVINFSYGITAGPHDGTSMIEREFERVLSSNLHRPTTFMLPAGNAQLSRAHAAVHFGKAAMEPAELMWRLQPNNLTTSRLELWLPGPKPGADNRVEIEIVTPYGEVSGALGEDAGAEIVLYSNDGKAIAVASYSYEVQPTDRGLFQISVRPTDHLRPDKRPDASAGVWSVRVYKGKAYANETVEAWIQRDDTAFGYPVRARQSYFDDPAYEEFERVSGRAEDEDPSSSSCQVKRVSLINAIATSCGPVVVGGVYRKEMFLAEYTAGGPTWTAAAAGATPRAAPDVVGVSDDSRIHWGVLGAGSRSGSAFALSGTSVSTPQIARVAADKASQTKVGDPPIGRAEIVADAYVAEKKHPRWPRLNTDRSGVGRLLTPSDRPRRLV